MPLVSLIINNYNYEAFVSEAIDSALAQTFDEIEVIVVDDGSTDGSWAVIEGYGDRIIAIAQTNGKQGKAFNTGFARSQGEIIIFLDADDYLYPNAVEKIVEQWNDDLSKVHYRLEVVDKEGKSSGFSYPQGGKKLAEGPVWERLLDVATYPGVPTSGNALSRRTLEALTPIPEDFKTMADDYLSVLVPFYGPVKAIEQPLAAYRVHGNNQWAISTMNSARLHRFIAHDMARCELLRQRAPGFGHEVAKNLELRFFGRMWFRLASLKLDPAAHPVPSDRSLPLAYHGIRALWHTREFNSKRKLILSAWFCWVGIFPKPIAKPAIVWFLTPGSRPKIIGRTLKKIRAVVG
ncbi:MAG: glycosyltransferase [Cyanobacteria bacterium P01_F01_bin.53]